MAPSQEQLVLRDADSGQPVIPGWGNLGQSVGRSVAVSPDGRWVAAASAHHSVFLLSADGRNFEPNELKHTNHLWSLSFHPDGHSLVTICNDGTARLWPLQETSDGGVSVGSPDMVPQLGSYANSSFSPDGSTWAIWAKGQIVIWERWQSQLVVGRINWPDSHWKPRPSFDGQLVTAGTKHQQIVELKPRGGTLQVGRMADGQPAGPPITLKGLLWDSCVCADNRSVAAATVDGATGALTVYDIASGALVFPSIALPDVPISVAARPEHSQVAVLCQNGTLLVVDHQQGHIVLNLSHDGWFKSGIRKTTPRVAYSPDGATLLTVTRDDRVFVRNAQTGSIRFSPLQPVAEGGPCRAIAFSPDSRLLATAVNGRNMVQVWDMMTGEKVGHEMPHPGDYWGLFSVAFSPDGQRILTGHKDGNARIWDWMTGALVGLPMKHHEEVYDAQFTPDGRHVVTVVRYSSPQVWDVATGKPAVPFPQFVPTGMSSHSLAITSDRVVVAAGDQCPVLDLAMLLQKPKEDLSAVLKRAELTTNQTLQHGELVPLLEAEWAARWDHWVAARQTPEAAAQSLAREFDQAQSESTRRAVAMRAMRLDLAERLQQLRPNDPYLQITLAVEFSRAGRQSELKRILPKAMADGQAALQKTPTNDSLQRGLTYLAAVLADQLLAEAEKATQWMVLEPTEMKSEGGATLTVQPDGSILASGKNPDQDAYVITANVALQHIKAIRLEAIPDASLPHDGPGRWPGSGNFHLNEFRALINGAPHKPAGIIVSYAHWRAGPQGYRNIIDGIIDGNHWSIHTQVGKLHSAVFATDLEVVADDKLTIELISSRGSYPQHNLGRFRLSVSDDPNAYVKAETRFADMKGRDPWTKLAIAYHLIGDQQAVDNLLKQHPQAAVGIVDLTVAAGDWPRVIEACSKLITDQTTDGTLLSRRAAAYVATGQKELAEADWLRAIALQPDLSQQAFDRFVKAEQWSTAAEFAERMFEQQPKNSTNWLELAPILSGSHPHLDLGELLGRSGRTDEALAAYRAAVNSRVMQIPDFVALASQLKDQQYAITALQSIIDNAGKNRVLALNNFAWSLVVDPDSKGQYPLAAQAVQWADQLCELAPNNGMYQNTLGVAQYRVQQWQPAIDTLQESIKNGVDLPHNWLFIAMAHWQLDQMDQMDQMDQAKGWYDKSLAWQTANADAARADAELQRFYAEAAKLMPELLEALLAHGP